MSLLLSDKAIGTGNFMVTFGNFHGNFMFEGI